MWINTNRSLIVYFLFCGERVSGEKVDHFASCSSAEWLKTSQKSTPETASRELARSYNARNDRFRTALIFNTRKDC
jgi:hypothetical protein